MTVEPTVTAWPGPGAPTEAALRARYAAEGLSPYAWGNGPGDRYGVHSHATHKVLYCLQGSITFTLDDRALTLAPGDRLDLPAGTRHGALVGPQGVTCLEAHR
jgi:mannose-6-phosphate isomerase-like protein (cupin superfamily)